MDDKYCERCTQFRGYSNTGYWCNIDKQEVDRFDYCKCYKGEDEE